MKICKCGHTRNEHARKYLNYEDCSKCRCSDYLRRDKPTTLGKILSIILISTVGLIWITFGSMYFLGNDMLTESYDEPYEISLGEFLEMNIMWGGILFLLYTLIVLPIALEDFRHKRRIKYPVESEE